MHVATILAGGDVRARYVVGECVTCSGVATLPTFVPNPSVYNSLLALAALASPYAGIHRVFHEPNGVGHRSFQLLRRVQRVHS